VNLSFPIRAVEPIIPANCFPPATFGRIFQSGLKWMQVLGTVLMALLLSLLLGSSCLPGPQEPCPAHCPGRVHLTCSPSSGSVSRPSWSQDTTVGLSRYTCPALQPSQPPTSCLCIHLLILYSF
jgi:hypothetical protein